MTLVVENLFFSYGSKEILKNLSFQLQAGEIGTLIGVSGSGKSTLFKLLTGLIPAKEGSLILNGARAPQGYQNIAYMMQQDLLLPWRTVLSNLLLVTELGPTPSDQKAAKEEALSLLEEMGLKNCEDMYPDELSGGMRQRVSLARALLQKRPVLLLDEPFGALDVGLREQMYRLLRQIQKKHGTTMLMVTHDFRDALSLSDRLFLLAEGHIYKEWEIRPTLRHNFEQMGLIQYELQQILIQSYKS